MVLRFCFQSYFWEVKFNHQSITTMSYQSFEELDAWKAGREFRLSISALSKNFPAEEKYKLVSQIHRSSRSVTANIAEGHGRFHYQENIQFCRVARGSLTETLDHLILANDEGYIDQHKLSELRLKFSECLRLINGYISYPKKRKSGDKSTLKLLKSIS